MIELIVIKSLLNIDNYNKYRHHIKLKEEDKELKELYSVLDKTIQDYNKSITFDEYSVAVLIKYPDHQTYLDKIKNSDISDEFLSDRIKELIDRSLAYDLAIEAISVSEGKKPISTILDFYSKFESKQSIDDIEFVTDDLEELYSETVSKPGLRWRLNSLNRMLGSLRKGDFGFIFARPETGKTTFLASEITYFAEQTDRPILWFNNEEQGSKVKIRCYQAALGIDLVNLYANRQGNIAEYTKRTNNNIWIYDSASITKRQVEKIVKETEPACIIFDQIDKIKGFEGDRNDLRLGSIYIWARELAKTYCPVIGVCQADVTGEGKKWLTMDNVAESKTAKQAEADFIVGIGKTHDTSLEFLRYLHASKNKLSGDSDTDPNLRHGRIEVVIHPDIARYADI